MEWVLIAEWLDLALHRVWLFIVVLVLGLFFFKAASLPISERQPLAQVASWCLGEYGDSLISGHTNATEQEEPVSVSYRVVGFFFCFQRAAPEHCDPRGPSVGRPMKKKRAKLNWN